MRKRTVILGGGESGVGAALLAAQQGDDVFLSDQGSLKIIYKEALAANGIVFEEGQHTPQLILEADEVVKSPGIPEKNEWIQKIRAKGIPIISEIELAHRHKGNSKIVAITGSNGKTTTTSLLWQMCQQAGVAAALVGNIGYSFAKAIVQNPQPLYIAEISSFQLDDIQLFKPEIAILTNITPDHLDRYNYQFENYINSKFRIALNQTQENYFIYCADDAVTTQYLQQHTLNATLLPFSIEKTFTNGAYIKNEQMTVTDNFGEDMEMSIFDFALTGKHNQYNTMAAATAALTLGLSKAPIREAIRLFQSLEHRMEWVATIKGINFINDSKATNVNSTWYALDSMKVPVVLILGGVDKGNDYDFIMDMVKEKVKAIVCMGLDNIKIHEAFGHVVPLIVNTSNMQDAVQAAYHVAVKGDTVLLSPACSSFDLFYNYEARGNKFKETVKVL
jgi:UDP-N-acetylmuramoylalanine--D-glutamate ligase